MLFDQQNPINQLCAQGMLLEGEAKPEEAAKLFMQAWNEATNTAEKFIAAHYVARHQDSVADKLKWDDTALSLALGLDNPEVNGALPSLYLNIAKCYEDLKDFDKAAENYKSALECTKFLPEDGYSNMIRSGIKSGMERVSLLSQ
ncbi:MAG TPA: tetratricopeptide repeat protein [Mucilaginibacter sp.]|jgi:rifampin ADP-ribosylating transferase|nr:tetratricopeptide repeat protein [Mucilaginibacter sp.]